MTPPKQYTRTELFAIWYKGQHTVAELAKTHGYDQSSLSASFTREHEKLKKAKADRLLLSKSSYIAPRESGEDNHGTIHTP